MEKRLLYTVFLLALSVLLFSSCIRGGDEEHSGTGKSGEDHVTDILEDIALPPAELSSFSELNRGEYALDDHKGVTALSSLELDYRNAAELFPYQLATQQAFYPRIKRLADGSYIMFYSGGRTGPYIYTVRSTDLKTWTSPICLARPEKTDEAGVSRYCANGDAVELKNGDILFCCNFRPSDGRKYENDMDSNGLMIRRSKDGGVTWSEPEIIYKGMCWEPALIELDNGDVVVIFTHPAPYINMFGYHKEYRSTGSAILRSRDGGITFEPKVFSAPYEAQRVMQVYTGELDGQKKMNDQMPIPLRLNNGTVVVATETKLINMSFRISLGYFYDNFTRSLEMFEEGPEDRLSGINAGYGPYLCQFPSGETLLTYSTIDYRLGFRLGNEEGKSFGAARYYMDSLTDSVTWPSTCLIDSHTAIAVGEKSFYEYAEKDGEKEKTIKYRTLCLAPLQLNHRIEARYMTPAVDGSSYDWKDSTDALFVGSESRAQISVRAAYNEETLYFFIDCLDEDVRSEDSITLQIAANETEREYIKCVLYPLNAAELYLVSGGKEERINANIRTASVMFGTLNESAKDEGYTVELSISREAMPKIKESFRFLAILNNADEDKVYPSDTFDGADMNSPALWQQVVMK